MKRGVAAVAVAAVSIFPAAAGAARIGPEVPGAAASTQACAAGSGGCDYINNRLRPDWNANAPFTGRLTRWRLQGGNGDYALGVWRKLSDGAYKLLRVSAAENVVAPSVSHVESISLPPGFRIRRGQFIGLFMAEGSTGVASTQSGASCTRGFVPAPAVGTAAFPNPGFSQCGRHLGFNARLVD